MTGPLVLQLDSLRAGDVATVGGKAASLGELSAVLAGTAVGAPRGFAVTADGFRLFAAHAGLDQVRDTAPADAGSHARAMSAAVAAAAMPPELADAIRAAYEELCRRTGRAGLPVAVRSSATTEDLPGASFAGQHASFLAVSGADRVVEACQSCFASLFTARAVEYRRQFGIDERRAALAIAVHEMVAWPDCEAAGVIFTVDTETGFPSVVVINASWGVGESVVQGEVNPDEFVVFKPTLSAAPHPIIAFRAGSKLVMTVGAPGGGTRTVATPSAKQAALAITHADALLLARTAVTLERHYGHALDIEWAKDGATGQIFVIQARPETVHSMREVRGVRSYTLTGEGELLSQGVSVGSGVVPGTVRVVSAIEGAVFNDGDILVAAATSPDWVSLMRRAGAIVTDHGGRTSHAAIVSRELGVPAVVGTGDATARIPSGERVTVACIGGAEGQVYRGEIAFESHELPLHGLPETRTHVMINLSVPDAAFRWWRLPVDGVGLARIEFIIGDDIRAHPMALLHPERVPDARVRDDLAGLARGYESGAAYFVDRLSQGIARIAASQYPKPVVVRLSDFKSNEYADLVGGSAFERVEPNPMLGFRGASRYYSDRYREAFALECEAIRRVRESIGLSNVIVMIPFCRTVDECDRVLAEMARNGLARGGNGLKVWVMCEIPSNVIRASDFAERIDGFSIGSNDLTQLVLGVDRDSADLRGLFSERDPAVMDMIRDVIVRAHASGVTVGFCGQAPSDDPDFAAFLVRSGIDSVSVMPDTVPAVRRIISEAERELDRRAAR